MPSDQARLGGPTMRHGSVRPIPSPGVHTGQLQNPEWAHLVRYQRALLFATDPLPRADGATRTARRRAAPRERIQPPAEADIPSLLQSRHTHSVPARFRCAWRATRPSLPAVSTSGQGSQIHEDLRVDDIWQREQPLQDELALLPQATESLGGRHRASRRARP